MPAVYHKRIDQLADALRVERAVVVEAVARIAAGCCAADQKAVIGPAIHAKQAVEVFACVVAELATEVKP